MTATSAHDIVQSYYGEELRSNADLKTSACCEPEAVPDWLKPLLANVHEDVTQRYYGCGLVAPELLRGRRVLDLGCGAGRDVYLLSQLVGPEGEVVGVDMTANQLEVARAHREYHRMKFGHAESNVTFLEGYLEKLNELPLKAHSFDVIVSNCVVNLTTDKAAVFRGAHRLLKPGGEMYFADVFADRRVPDAVRNDRLLYGECLGGAQYWRDFLDDAQASGFRDPRLVRDRRITITDAALSARVSPVAFYSATYRLFSLTGLETQCEDYGQAVVYRGTIENSHERFVLDKHHDIEVGRVFPVCGNTWRMLHDTRMRPHFDFIGSFDKHFGVYAGCGTSLPFTVASAGEGAGGACC